MINKKLKTDYQQINLMHLKLYAVINSVDICKYNNA